MYRQGLDAATIAELAGVGVRTIRYRLHAAAQAEPFLREEHQAAAKPVKRISGSGLRNMNETIALYRAEGRFPSTHAVSARERALAAWLHRRRQETHNGTLPAAYRQGLQAIPGWDRRPPLEAGFEARWSQRLTDLVQYMAAGNDWPRHRGGDTGQEAMLGVWLHVQRINHR
jgi:hypothetical protein